MGGKGPVNPDDKGFFLGDPGPGNKYRERHHGYAHEQTFHCGFHILRSFA
jgi:hypothetical protein